MQVAIKPFVAVIGHRGSGKSTLIKSLTGCPTNSTWSYIDDVTNAECIYVAASSLQEEPYDVPYGAPQMAELTQRLNHVHAMANCRGMVMAMQPSWPRVRPSMENVIATVQAHGGFQVFAYALDPPRHGQAPFGGILQDVTNRLAQYGIVPVAVDANQFAFNAVAPIPQQTGIV